MAAESLKIINNDTKLNREYLSESEIQRQLEKTKSIINSGDRTSLKYLILCHGRRQGIPLPIKQYWNNAVLLDKDDDSKPDLYIDITKEIPHEYEWMRNHFDIVILWRCPTEILLFNDIVPGIPTSLSKTFDNIVSYVKPTGKLIICPRWLMYPLEGTTTESLLAPYKDKIKVITEDIVNKILILQKIQSGGTYISYKNNSYKNNYYKKYIKYKTKYLNNKNNN